MPDWLAEVNALFYVPQLYPLTKKLSGPQSYRNPYTGEAFVKTIDELFLEAVNDTIWFCKVLENAMGDNCYFKLEERGPSLVTGLNEEPETEKFYFAEELWFR